MQTGNIFALLGIVDPDGDPLRIRHANVANTGLMNVPGTGVGTYAPYGGAANTVLELAANGDFSLDLGDAKTGRYGPQQVYIEIHYTDDKGADHTADDTVDQVVRVNWNFTGDLPENAAPPAPPGNVGDITYVADV